MNKNALRILIMITLCLLFASCSGNSSTEVTDDATVYVPHNESIGGYLWTLDGGAMLDGATLLCPEGATAVCSDSSLPNSYILECDITATDGGSNGIAINNVSEDYHYILELNSKSDKIILNKYFEGKAITVADADFVCGAGEAYHLKLAVYASSVKIFLTDDDEVHPQIDVIIDKYRPNHISVISKSEKIEVNNIMISSNDMTLSAAERYTNPIATGADPFVLYHDGVYYLYSTNAVNSGYRVFTSKDLKTWEDKGLCLETKNVYGAPTQKAGFWAPEVYHYNGRFYLIYTVEEHLGIAVADSPLGPFVSPKQSFISEHNEIDGHLFFDDDGKVYIYFVRCGSSVGNGRGNEIFGAEFDMETFTYKNEKCLIYPEPNTWEWIGDHGYVAEGPAVLKHDGRYYLSYSANGYTSQDYAIGVAVADSPLGSYKKYDGNPILKKSDANGVYGPGHHSFTYSPDGTELFIVYHRHFSKVQIHERTTCIDRAYFKYDAALGYDILKVAGPTSTAQPLPSGTVK